MVAGKAISSNGFNFTFTGGWWYPWVVLGARLRARRFRVWNLVSGRLIPELNSRSGPPSSWCLCPWWSLGSQFHLENLLLSVLGKCVFPKLNRFPKGTGFPKCKGPFFGAFGPLILGLLGAKTLAFGFPSSKIVPFGHFPQGLKVGPTEKGAQPFPLLAKVPGGILGGRFGFGKFGKNRSGKRGPRLAPRIFWGQGNILGAFLVKNLFPKKAFGRPEKFSKRLRNPGWLDWEKTLLAQPWFGPQKTQLFIWGGSGPFFWVGKKKPGVFNTRLGLLWGLGVGHRFLPLFI